MNELAKIIYKGFNGHKMQFLPIKKYKLVQSSLELVRNNYNYYFKTTL